MLAIGDIYVYVTDLPVALRFYRDGLGLTVVEHEASAASAFARLDFPDGGPSLRLFGGAEPWPLDGGPPDGTRPSVRFDIATDDFDGTLSRLIECGGQQVDDVERYDDLRVVTVSDPDGNTFELLEVPA